MRSARFYRHGPKLWFICGGLVGFGLFSVALASMGALTLPPGLILAIVMLFLGVHGLWLFVGGFGIVPALGWASLILDPNAPDDELWPLAVGLAIGSLGIGMFYRERARSRTSQAAP